MTTKKTGFHYIVNNKHYTRVGAPVYSVSVIWREGSYYYHREFDLHCYDHEIPSRLRTRLELPKTTKIVQCI